MDFNSLSELLEDHHCRFRYAITSLHLLNNLPPEKLPEVNFGLSEKRNQEYLLGRLSIKDALGSLGYPPTWIERDQRTKTPVWPEGITGSLSHSSGLALAVVSNCPAILGLGVDLEKANRTIDLKIERHICTQDESEDLHSLHPENQTIRLLLTFSAKESLYKCFFGEIPRDLLRFKNVSLKWESNTWTAHWRFPSEKKYPMEKTIGYWGMDLNWLWTICWRL
ncbi:MAG: 4'-phosphopantetheinyl transferase superfamily protein [Deltaproteobacteria bacterium]|nr:4'-phosphopantetheinyl transferase superfamily protein [Deltaproteobacteria bacterium]